ncbi:MAG TPA: methylmalonyl-CoA epimerase [Actinocatenispora sp.]
MPTSDESRRASHLTTGLSVLRVDHVGIAVADLDTAIAYWTETFGLTCVHTETNPDQGVREAMLRAADGETMLQLLAPLTPDSTIAAFLDRRGPGLQQLAYTVADVAAAGELLRARGVRLLYDAPRTGTGGSLINFVHPKDAGGVLVELVQPPSVTDPNGS